MNIGNISILLRPIAAECRRAQSDTVGRSRKLLPFFLCVAGLAFGAPPSDAQKQAWIAAAATARVRVAYTLMFADGEEPSAPGLVTRYLCPNCGSYHTDNDAKRSVHEKRDAEAWGWLVAPQTVLVQDAQIPKRFLKSIRVTHGQDSVGAREDGFFRGKNAALLTLEKPLPGTAPLVFSGNKKDERFLLCYTHDENDWQSSLIPYAPRLTVDEALGLLRVDETDGLVLDSAGAPVRIAIAGQEAFTPEPRNHDQWEKVSTEEEAQWLGRIAANHGTSICLATLQFRSPRNTAEDMPMHHRFRDDDDDDADSTVRYAVACQLSPGRFLVIKKLPHNVTARLEKILLTTPASDTVEAAFVASLSEFGAFVADYGGAEFAPVAVSETPSQIPLHGLLCNDILSVNGGELQATLPLPRTRVTAIEEIYDGILFPNDSTDEKPGFVFDADGKLCGLPIALRFVGDSSTPMPYPATRLKEIITTLPAGTVDASNVPLPASEENRTAWLGADVQPMTPDLALASKAARFFADNEQAAGLIVSVYPNSPAERAGLREGDILLRVSSPQTPVPIPIIADDDNDDREFPWERYDEIPLEAFENAPTPWAPINNSFSAMLTCFGLGSTCTVDYVRDGKPLQAQLPIEASPPIYDSAERFPAKDYGLTVCDITFEARRYFNLAADAPGILIVTIEAGSAAAERGLKPFEIITHVDDTPVQRAAGLAALLDGKAEVRLTIRRMQKERVAILKPGKPAKGLLKRLFNL